MFQILRRLRHNKIFKDLFIWNLLGLCYRFFIKILPFNFYVNQKITNNFSLKLHALFAFSNFTEWGNKHDTLFHTYLALCKKSMCFMDIGAHIGLVSLPASTVIKKGGIVYSFEPSSRNLFFLKYHIKINNIKNIKVINKLVGSDNTNDHTFYESNEPSGMNSIIKIREKNIVRTKKVESISVDYFCRENKIKPDLIKVDIEGGEIKMLEGATEVIKKFRPIIFLSYHPIHIEKLGFTKKKIFQLLDKFNYKILDSNAIIPKILENSEYLLVPKKFNISKILNV